MYKGSVETYKACCPSFQLRINMRVNYVYTNVKTICRLSQNKKHSGKNLQLDSVIHPGNK
jgi:hypothetical protein